MYGTVAKLKVAPGKADAVREIFETWDRERKDQVDGAVAGYLYKLDNDPDGMMMVAVFSDRNSYQRNADDPAQDAWYRQFRELLAEDPEWNDGEVVASS